MQATVAFPTEEPKPTPSLQTNPTPVIDINVTPGASASGFVGPLLVYEKAGSRQNVLVAYDLGSGRVLWSAQSRLEGFTGVSGVALAGQEVIVATSRKVRVYGPDGRPGDELYATREGEYVRDIAASSDGAVLAISLSGPPEPIGTPGPFGQQIRQTGSLVFIDLGSRAVLQRLESKQPEFEAARGTFGGLIWRDDGTGVVLDFETASERPGGEASVFVDGRVVLHDLEGFAYVADNGRIAVEGVGTLGCLALAGRRIALKDLDSGVELVTVGTGDRIFSGRDWSPDSNEFLFVSRPYDEAQICNIRSLPAQLFTVSREAGAIAPVTDLTALYRRWYGDALIWMDCGPELGFAPVTRSYIGHAGVSCSDAEGNVSEGTLRYRQLEIDQGTGFRIYGISK